MLVNARIRLLAGVLLFIQFASLGGILVLTILNPTNSYTWVNLGLIFIAIYLLFSASNKLSPSFRVNPIPRENVPLIRSGIYKRIRHPMYLALILFAFGISGFSSHSGALVLTGILIINLVVKAKLEDNLLLQIHPESSEYLANTPGFIPCRCNSS